MVAVCTLTAVPRALQACRPGGRDFFPAPEGRLDLVQRTVARRGLAGSPPRRRREGSACAGQGPSRQAEGAGSPSCRRAGRMACSGHGQHVDQQPSPQSRQLLSAAAGKPERQGEPDPRDCLCRPCRADQARRGWGEEGHECAVLAAVGAGRAAVQGLPPAVRRQRGRCHEAGEHPDPRDGPPPPAVAEAVDREGNAGRRRLLPAHA